MPEGSHISDVGVCKDWGEVKKGDKLKVIAYYDDKTHMQMRDKNGNLEKQMGMIWVRILNLGDACLCGRLTCVVRFIWVLNRNFVRRRVSIVSVDLYFDASAGCSNRDRIFKLSFCFSSSLAASLAVLSPFHSPTPSQPCHEPPSLPWLFSPSRAS